MLLLNRIAATHTLLSSPVAAATANLHFHVVDKDIHRKMCVLQLIIVISLIQKVSTGGMTLAHKTKEEVIKQSIFAVLFNFSFVH